MRKYIPPTPPDPESLRKLSEAYRAFNEAIRERRLDDAEAILKTMKKEK